MRRTISNSVFAALLFITGVANAQTDNAGYLPDPTLYSAESEKLEQKMHEADSFSCAQATNRKGCEEALAHVQDLFFSALFCYEDARVRAPTDREKSVTCAQRHETNGDAAFSDAKKKYGR